MWSFFIKEKNIPKVVLDEVIGAEMRCSVVNDDRQLVVVHKDDMKFFEADDIGPCSALEGTKKQVIFYKNYYVVVTEETKDVVAEKNTITVYDWRDRRNKFIAFQTQVRPSVRSDMHRIDHCIAPYRTLCTKHSIFTGKIKQSNKNVGSSMHEKHAQLSCPSQHL